MIQVVAMAITRSRDNERHGDMGIADLDRLQIMDKFHFLMEDFLAGIIATEDSELKF